MSEDEFFVSTGVGSLDRLLQGGISTGMHVVFSGETGAGEEELIRTMLISLLQQKSADADDSMNQPSSIGYISATRSYFELEAQLLAQSPDILMDDIKFLDLSPAIFLGSSVPQRWMLEDEERLEEIASMGRTQLIQGLVVQFLETLPSYSVVFLDFITEMACLGHVMDWDDLLLLLYGVRRLSHNQHHVICTLSNHIALGEQREEMIANTADAVLNFAWDEVTSYQRQRIMFIRKWPGLSFSPEEGSSMKFAVSSSKHGGFEVSTVQQILGR